MGRTLEPTGLWILVTAPAYYRALPQELARNDGLVTWSGPKRLTVGDLAILYQSSPSKEFKWLLRARSEPVPDPYFKHMAWFEALAFERGVGFSEAARDPIIATFPKMRAHLVGSNHVVPEDVWERLVEMLVGRNPGTRATVESWTEQLPDPLERSLADFKGADFYGFEPAFREERAMEDFVLEQLLRKALRAFPIRGMASDSRAVRIVLDRG